MIVPRASRSLTPFGKRWGWEWLEGFSFGDVGGVRISSSLIG